MYPQMTLTALAVKNYPPEAKPSKKPDGRGLFLLVNPNGSKYWRLRCSFNGKDKLLGVGVYCGPTKLDGKGQPLPAIIIMTLAEARTAADAARELIAQGIDPSGKKKADKQQAAVDIAQQFRTLALEWHSKEALRWNSDHAARVLRRLELNLFPALGHRAMADLKARDLIDALRPVEARGAMDVANRCIQAIQAIFRYAVQTGRIDTNPAIDITGALATAPTIHRPALPFNRLPELLARIDDFRGHDLTRLAVRFCLLTFVRSSELRFMRWDEVNRERAVWVIPAVREAIEGVKHSERGAKMRTDHVVPLSRQALAVLADLHTLTGGGLLVFPSRLSSQAAMSDGTINKALRLMGYDTKTEQCGHGFRTLACSALTESGKWDVGAVELQMSHIERNTVRAAYTHKVEHLPQRVAMMQWWADYLDAQRGGDHVPPHAFDAAT
jgi:integrase